MQTGVLLDINVVRDFIRDNIGDITFQEAYDKTGWIFNVTVTGYGEHDQDRILNYLTAPNVLIWSAVCCSCSIPHIYGASDLYC
jgi:predicted acylesterase/phospholipase RssA